MQFTDVKVTAADGSLGTPDRIIKVNHAAEFGAINIYRAVVYARDLKSGSCIAIAIPAP